MTNEIELVQELTEEEEGLPCIVRHEHAGGACGRLATVQIYGLGFCEAHGEEVKLAAFNGAAQDTRTFLEGLLHPPGSHLSVTTRTALKVAIGVTWGDTEDFTGEAYDRALLEAYSDPPEKLREAVLRWIEEEGGNPPVFESLLESLDVVHKTMRIAYEADETWLTEILEEERETVAAQAAVAATAPPLKAPTREQ
jgi:hypothetical protein